MKALKCRMIPRGTDYDVGDALNIFFKIPDQEMPYPYGYHYEEEGKTKPNLMVIADSYYWTIYNLHDSKKLWNEQDFRYYDLQVFSPEHPDKVLPKVTMDELLKFDFIMVLYTEMNMHVLANLFFEKAYAVLFKSRRFEEIKAGIMNDEQWLASIGEKANRKGISLEEMMDLDAMWILVQEIKNNTNETNKE